MLLVEVVKASGIALIISVSEVEGADNSDILALSLILPLRVKTLTFFIIREAIDCGYHPFRRQGGKSTIHLVPNLSPLISPFLVRLCDFHGVIADLENSEDIDPAAFQTQGDGINTWVTMI